MTKVLVRDANDGDLGAIAQVAVAAGQDEEWSGSDPAYVRHLLAHGRVVVAELDGRVTGFGATRQVGAATMLCDLFVDPQAHGRGVGRAMLDALWTPGTLRMTFSSTHAHALPLYTRAGLDAWWPLLYLAGDVASLRAPGGWSVAAADADEVGAQELGWTGLDRTADHRAWAARPAGQSLIAYRDGEPVAAGTAAGAGAEYGVVHLAIAPAAAVTGGGLPPGHGDPGRAITPLAAVTGGGLPPGHGDPGRAFAPPPAVTDGGRADRDTPDAAPAELVARDAVIAVLTSLDAPGGRARVCLPAPHPAVRPLLAAGWRSEYLDLFMATDPTLLDPRRAVPSPALA